MFLGDPTQLHQVLLNLCVNARDAMPEGGDLTISAGNVMVDPRLPGLDQGAKPGPHIVIKVSDTGTGMSAEIREKIFVPFFTTKEVGKGTGLGLSTTLGIVKNHGGFIDVTSELGEASIFEVWLPAKTLAEPSAPEAAEARLPRGNGERILVVDDEASLRAMTQHILEVYGYVVLTAANGGDAMALYSRDEKGVDFGLDRYYDAGDGWERADAGAPEDQSGRARHRRQWTGQSGEPKQSDERRGEPLPIQTVQRRSVAQQRGGRSSGPSGPRPYPLITVAPAAGREPKIVASGRSSLYRRRPICL